MREKLYFSSYSRKLGGIGYRVGALVKGREPVEGGRGDGGVGGCLMWGGSGRKSQLERDPREGEEMG